MTTAASPRPPILQNVTFIYTPDLDATARFYAETIGLTQVLDQGVCRIFQASRTAFLGVCSRSNRAVSGAGVVVTMVTPEVDAWYARLKAAGVDLVDPPRLSEEFNIYAFFARDPNGYLIEFQEFRDPAWPAP